HFDAVLARVVEQQLIEPRSLYLKRALVRRLEVLVEAKDGRRRAVRGDERAAVFRKEVAFHQLLVDAKTPEDVVRVRKHRFADLEARKTLALEEQYGSAALRQDRGRGRAGGPAADDDDVVH